MENEMNREVKDEEVKNEEIKGEVIEGGETNREEIPAPAAAGEKPEKGGVTAADQDKGGLAESGLTDDEKKLVRNYAVNDPEVRRAIISDYIGRLKSADHVPEVIQGDAGASPVFVPRAARDMREAAVLAEALLKRK